MMKPKIQLALDTSDLGFALKAAWELHECVEIIEAGTHLLLAEGLRCVRLLKDLFPEKVVLADTKIIDGGDMLAKDACSSGADVITVVSAASQPTILKAASAAHLAGRKVLLDHLSTEWDSLDILTKAALDVDYVGLHLPKDLQDSTKLEANVLGKAINNFTKPIYLAGGVEPELVRKMIGLPIEGFVIGNYLLEGSNRTEKARALKNLVNQWN
jgi:3-keto-L-gulonate-6-phosphate decarboxylase